MRKLTASRILMPHGLLETDLAVVFDDKNRVSDVIPRSGAGEVEQLDGILLPGFINVHCHLELSHLSGLIPKGEMLPVFIRDFVNARTLSGASVSAAAQVADEAMWIAGIQAVGDISNRNDTIGIKGHSRIRYHSFIEVYGLDAGKAAQIWSNGNALLAEYHQAGCNATIVPHAPYSMSPELFAMIRKHHPNAPWTIHSQESDAERELFMNGSGPFVELFSRMGLDYKVLPTGKGNSLHYIAEYFPANGNLLLVHNTYTRESDITFLNEAGFADRCWFALCPKANLYIEKSLPDVQMMRSAGCKLTIGTDSVASNDRLDILDEIKTISRAFPKIPASELLQWATANGADYFDWKDLGRFLKGTTPGCIRIETGHDLADASMWKYAERII